MGIKMAMDRVKQSIVIECKTFNFEVMYVGNTRILKITKRRRKGYVSSVCFRICLVS